MDGNNESYRVTRWDIGLSWAGRMAAVYRDGFGVLIARQEELKITPLGRADEYPQTFLRLYCVDLVIRSRLRGPFHL